MPSMEKDACKTTQCPTTIDQLQTYKYNLKIDNYFPISTFEVKMILQGDNPDEEQCCFGFKSKIIK